MIKNFVKKSLLVSSFLLFSNLIFSQESKITSTFDATYQFYYMYITKGAVAVPIEENEEPQVAFTKKEKVIQKDDLFEFNEDTPQLAVNTTPRARPETPTTKVEETPSLPKNEPPPAPVVEKPAEPKVEPKPEPKVEPKPEPKEEPKPEPKIEKPAEPKVEPKEEPKPEPKVEKPAEPKVEPKEEPKPEPKVEKPAEPKPEPKVEPKKEPEPKVEKPAEPKVEPKKEPEPKVEKPAEPKEEPKKEPEPKVEKPTEPKVEPKKEPEPKVEKPAEPKPEPKVEPKKEPEPKVEKPAEPKTEPKKEPEPKVEKPAEPKTEPKKEPEPKVEKPAEPKVEPKKEPEPKVEKPAEPKVEPKKEPEPKVEKPAEPKVEPKKEPEPKVEKPAEPKEEPKQEVKPVEPPPPPVKVPDVAKCNRCYTDGKKLYDGAVDVSTYKKALALFQQGLEEECTNQDFDYWINICNSKIEYLNATLQIEPQSIVFEAEGGTKSINISTNFSAWENDEISPALLKWLNGEKDKTKPIFNITCAESKSLKERKGTITIKAGVKTSKIEVIQKGKKYLFPEVLKLIYSNFNTNATLYQNNSIKYKGEKNLSGHRSGMGAQLTPSGDIFFGRFNNGECTEGFYFDSDVTIISDARFVNKYQVGNFSKFELNGDARSYDEDGVLTYRGTFDDGSPLDGSYWKDDRYPSDKVEVIEDKTGYYLGETKSGIPHGKGVYIYKQGDMWYGDWINGEKYYGIELGMDGFAQTGTDYTGSVKRKEMLDLAMSIPQNNFVFPSEKDAAPKLDETNKMGIKKTAEALKANTLIKVIVTAYNSLQWEGTVNHDLANRRALAIKQLYLEQGISSDQVEIHIIDAGREERGLLNTANSKIEKK